MQLTHYTSKFNQRTFPITLVCENVTNAANIGSLFRTADAFGLEQVIFCGSPIPFGRKMAKTSRATEKYVNFKWQENSSEVIHTLKASGFQIIALEISASSTPLSNMTLDTQKPIALLIGDENFGVSEACLKLSDHSIHIDMFGHNSSMNVVQATSIALYEITKQLVQL
ncbi:SpoU rRNA methylase family protein [Gelidibacter algens]|uniref:SpoU rRNA methylase family protein n=1 Tax=Gelidibacter algens TaxID=49280 RepID=A0A1A7R734_9FLAO|nr:TrmH family RNA methyltransferase [Gelidibacter algens]OBX26557.1 RNA methyltransferase [Gelidibacter algens]RAJ26613.1 SpoU rRNA methylase family protein [Gelidibacter algens]